MNDIWRRRHRHLLRELLQHARSLIQQEEIYPAFGTNFLPMWPTKCYRVPIISTKFKLYRPKLGIDGSNDGWVWCIDLNLTGLRTNRAAAAAWVRLRVWVWVRVGTRTRRCHARVTKTRQPKCWWTENTKECGLPEVCIDREMPAKTWERSRDLSTKVRCRRTDENGYEIFGIVLLIYRLPLSSVHHIPYVFSREHI